MNLNAKEYIKADMFRYYGKNKISIMEKIKYTPEQKYIILLRKTQFEKNHIKKLYYKIMLRHKKNKTQIQIPDSAKIGKGLYLGHLGTIVINPNVEIGCNVNIATGVTIGQTNRGDKQGTPIIGNRVWIGTNSVIVGKIKIGNNVLIAPNSYVNFDVPNDSIVIGNPGKIYHKLNACDKYIENTI